VNKLLSTILVLVCSVSLAWAAEPVAAQISTQLNAQARQMVELGVPAEAAAKMQNCFQQQQMIQARNTVQAAVAQGVPVGPVVDKAMEGMAKKAAAQNIVAAMEQVRSRYAAAIAEARQITRTRSRQRAMTQAMAQAMAAGMPAEDMSAIAAQVRSRRQTMAHTDFEELAEKTCVAARDMARMGLSSKAVKDTLSLALQNQYSAKQMNQIRSQFMQQAKNAKAEVVADRLQAQVRAGGNGAQQGTASGGAAGSGSNGSSSGNGGSSNGGGSDSGNGGGSGSGSGSGSDSGNGGGSGSGSGSGSDSGNGGGSGNGSGGGGKN
jgi:hypothetical protein